MIIGLTGGIGSGKTTVANMFSDFGIPIYVSDIEARKLMESSTEIHNELVALFGNKAIVNNKPDRAYIGNIVFQDKTLLQKLNSIVHPVVQKHFKQWYHNCKAPYVIKESAILFEQNLNNSCDAVITVTAPIEIKIQRVIKRDGSDRANVINRMNNQWTDEQKIALSDFVIENIDIETTRKKVAEVHQILLKKAT